MNGDLTFAFLSNNEGELLRRSASSEEHFGRVGAFDFSVRRIWSDRVDLLKGL